MTSLERLVEKLRPYTELEPIGVIDIGSNSVRLVIYEGAVRAPTPLFNEKVLCGLGRSIAGIVFRLVAVDAARLQAKPAPRAQSRPSRSNNSR